MSSRPRRTPATRLLLIAIVIALAAEIVTGAWSNPGLLARMGAMYRPWILQNGEWWRLVSAMFLHGDGTIPGTALHVAVNLFSLYQLGTLYELMFGTRRFAIIYFAAGIVASLTSMIFNGGPSVGASGAIFGISGAFIVSVLRSPRFRHERVARSIMNQVVFWVIANIVIASQFPQIDNAAHIGGLVTGAVIGALWPHRVPPPPPTQVVVDVMPRDQ